MSWNNSIETKKYERRLKKLKEYWRECGMTEDQIEILEEDERNAFHARRRKAEYGQEIPLWVEDEDGFLHESDPKAMSYEEDLCEEDPFQYGFNDERLNKIVAKADETDMAILRLLSEGLNQRETGEALGLSQQFVSYRIKRFKKRLK